MRFAEPVPVFVIAVCTLALIGCGTEEPGEAQAAAGLSEADESRALALFDSEGCTVCHGEMANGQEGVGPGLKNLAPYWDVERLMVYLEDPEGFRESNPDFEDRRDTVFELEMPASDHLSDDQRKLLARWLLTR
jgi:cytochrome c551/c552